MTSQLGLLWLSLKVMSTVKGDRRYKTLCQDAGLAMVGNCASGSADHEGVHRKPAILGSRTSLRQNTAAVHTWFTPVDERQGHGEPTLTPHILVLSCRASLFWALFSGNKDLEAPDFFQNSW